MQENSKKQAKGCRIEERRSEVGKQSERGILTHFVSRCGNAAVGRILLKPDNHKGPDNCNAEPSCYR